MCARLALVCAVRLESIQADGSLWDHFLSLEGTGAIPGLSLDVF